MTEQKISNDSLIALEQSLKAKLNQVQPDREFVHRLQARLEESAILRHQRRTAAKLLTVAGGILIGLAIFLIGQKLLQNDKNS